MKRLNWRRRRWLFLRAANELRRKRTYSVPAAGERSDPPVSLPYLVPKIELPQSAGIPPRQYPGRARRRKPVTFMVPPAIFSLRENYEEVAAFFAHLRTAIYRDELPSHMWTAIDFKALKAISPAAALILAAELYRWQHFMKMKLNAVHQDKWHPQVRQVLANMGLFDFLQTPNFRTDDEHASVDDDVSVLKYRSHATVLGTECEDMLNHLTEISGPVRADNFIYDGLIEALKNSRQHAYTDESRWYGVDAGTWFMSGSYTRSTSTLTAAVFDLGVGVPQTLPRTGLWEHIRPYLSGADDAEMIAAAMKYGRSRTERQERGNGIPTMMRILDHHKGYLRILSGTGEVTYDSISRKVTPKNHMVPIGGTLIEWSISP